MSSQAKQTIGNIISYVALGFIIAAQTSRQWASVSTGVGIGVVDTYYGLYVRCIGGTSVCIDYDWTPSDTEEWASFITRILLIICDVFFAGAFLGSFVAFCLSGIQRSTCLKTIGAFNIVGGSFTVIAAIAYIALFLTSFYTTVISNIISINISQSFNIRYGYSFCWVAGILFIVAGVLQIAAAAPDQHYVQPSQTVIWTTTTQPAVALPSAPQQPYEKGYYNPSAIPTTYQQPQQLRANYPNSY